jgi:hypothetical protein
MKKHMIVLVVVLLLIPVISYGESETVAEGKKDTTYYKVKINADGKEETAELVNQPTLGRSPHERVAEECPVQTHLTQMTYYIYMVLHSPVTVRAFKRNADGTRGAELRIMESRYQIQPPPKNPSAGIMILDCSGDTELEFTGTSEAVGDKAHYWWEVQVSKQDGTKASNQSIGSSAEPIPIAPGQVHKAIITAYGGEIRPFFTGGSKRK